MRVLLLLLCFPLLLFARSEGSLDAGYVNPGAEEKPSWFKNSFLDIREDVAEAAAAERKVMLYFYQDGCPYCAKLLQDNFADQSIAEKTQAHFDTIAINLWGDAEVTDLQGDATTEKAFARELKVMFTPTLLMLDEQGNVAMRLNGYYSPARFAAALSYVGENHHHQLAFTDYLAQQPQTHQATGQLHDQPDYMKPPLRLTSRFRYGNKPLLVLFEQKVCKTCDEWHLDIFKRPETQTLLQQFDIVLLDMRSRTPLITPAGEQRFADDWARELNISYAPSMLFFDQAGQPVFSTGGYLKAFHVQSVLDYVASSAYEEQPEFQRYLDARADALRAQGVDVDIWK